MEEKLFISYSRKDKDKVFAIKDEVESFLGKGTCWIDLNGIESDQQFDDVIISAINRTEIFLFMYSENSAVSPWTKAELKFASNKKKKLVFLNIDNSELEDWFLFRYSSQDIIYYDNADQREKMFKNLKDWCGVVVEPQVESLRGSEPASAGSIFHIDVNRDCSVMKFGKELIPAKSGEDNQLRLMKGRHKLDFVTPEETVSIVQAVEDNETEDFIEVRFREIISSSSATPKESDVDTEVSRAAAAKYIQYDFWKAFKAYLEAHPSNEIPAIVPKYQHFYNIPLGRPGYTVCMILDTKAPRVGVRLYLEDDLDKSKYDQFFALKDQAEKYIGFPLQWNRLEGKKSSTVNIFMDGDFADVEKREAFMEWLKCYAEKYVNFFKPILLSEPNGQPEISEVDKGLSSIEEVANEIIRDLVENPKFKIYHLFSKNESYLVCKYLVTQSQWESVMNANPSLQKSPDYPVTNITAEAADEFIKKLSPYAEKHQYRLMLPANDMMWNTYGYMVHVEKEVKDQNMDDYFWHEGNSEDHLHPVGSKLPVLGIYDALGLVYEWLDGSVNHSTSLYGGSYQSSMDSLCAKVSKNKYFSKHAQSNEVGFRIVAQKIEN